MQNNEKTANGKREEELGALWEREAKDGSVYLSGYVTDKNGERIQLVLFVNKYKKAGEASPDWRIYESKPLAAKQSSSVTDRAKKAAPAAKASSGVELSEASDVSSETGEEIPF
jgi:uncharacterized protein (DUF736 family)